MSAASYVETGIVIDSAKSDLLSFAFEQFMNRMKIDIEPVTRSQAVLARDVYRRFGKGTGHPAQLNFGDCFALALSIESGEPLLYKGDDFAKAGIPNALYLD